MKIPRYVTHHSLIKVSLSHGAGPTLVVHSLAGVFPCFHASRSSLCYPWLMIGSLRMLTSLNLSTDSANVDVGSIGVRSSLNYATKSFYPIARN